MTINLDFRAFVASRETPFCSRPRPQQFSPGNVGIQLLGLVRLFRIR